ncbi:MAG: ankyrin repeat domain-containing protein [Alphaproteobacteria bacterium]
MKPFIIAVFGLAIAFAAPSPASAQVPPGQAEIEAYDGLFRAAADGDIDAIERLVANGAKLNARDGRKRTPLMVAAHMRQYDAARALIAAGANVDAFDADRYDVVTIAAVADDPQMLRVAIAGGANTSLVTSIYDGTALIAAAHLGHDEVVRTLIQFDAPLDHINNLDWTALIEAIVLGDGGKRHVATVRALVDAGADVDIADGRGVRPLSLARQREYTEIIEILEAAGAKP